MNRNHDQQVLSSATGLGLGVFAIALLLIPTFLPLFILYRIAVVTGATQLHPAILIVLAGASVWGLGGVVIRSVPPTVARLAIAAYIASCYTFVIFQRELTTARAELDFAWLLFCFGIFMVLGWRIGGAMVLKAHRDRLIRARRDQQPPEAH